MVYNWNIEVTHGTAVATAQKTVLRIAYGVIHHIEIYFPPGAHSLVHVHINRAIHQVWPTNPDDNIAYDDYVWKADEDYEIAEDPAELDFWAWNEDDTYNHIIRVSISILPREVIYPWSEKEYMLEELRGF